MLGMVLVTHGGLAREFISAMEHVVGKQQQIAAICIEAHDDMETRRRDIADAIVETDSGSGVIVLTDMFGGTPSNLAISLMGAGKSNAVEVIAGINLPMLIRLASVRGEMSAHDAIEAAQEAGRKYISVASKILGEVA
ncbi:PTS sugar transporter subunit IIA [Pacificimonas sp. WHA3]|uniref:PTS sugar transporter subunit IIA n=1 Tax=Pacificimonas pallii TaxID=2827236 RepID=A0ABS6SGG1_9SPHN|nr:PTS sugar transporter subunit IIA [Pacificimonas pallii]MBV7257436.1 PTS sugar transporter subunit IIA [Pacificimonas pallii]